MGIINHPVQLNKLIEEYGIKNYVETGVGDGTSMNIVLLTEQIDNLYGIELDKELYSNLKTTYKDALDIVHLYQGYTVDKMSEVMADVDEKPTLFWLDAHFPGADYKGESYGIEKDDIKRIPMEIELRIMSENRDLSKDVIIMDDLRIYVHRDFEAGCWEERMNYGGDGYDFVEEIIGETHILIEHLSDQGYLLAFPVKSSEEQIRSVLRL